MGPSPRPTTRGVAEGTHGSKILMQNPNTTKVVMAIANVESNGNPNIGFGDGGRAMGRFQVHPDWLWGWANHYHLTPNLDETWDSFVRRVVTAFVDDHLSHMQPAIVDMYFHLGHITYPKDIDWDQERCDKFIDAFGEQS